MASTLNSGYWQGVVGVLLLIYETKRLIFSSLYKRCDGIGCIRCNTLFNTHGHRLSSGDLDLRTLSLSPRLAQP
jgi:hypothetical protein